MSECGLLLLTCRQPFNHGVEGSSPSALTMKIRHYLYFVLRGPTLSGTRGRGEDTKLFGPDEAMVTIPPYQNLRRFAFDLVSEGDAKRTKSLRPPPLIVR
jgi:hypothetical protein